VFKKALDHKLFQKKFDHKPFQKRLERKRLVGAVGVINRRNGFGQTFS
jgi:hypothetical protein